MTDITKEIRELAAKYAGTLRERIDERVKEMEADDDSHRLIYQVLGIATEEGRLIDVYQNKGRFLYKYAGSFLEEATKHCFLASYPASCSKKIPNKQGLSPKKFEIDCLVGTDAIEIKWRDATTDGDHIDKERARIKAIVDAGYKPIRLMFYDPNRQQAIKVQGALKALYADVNGEYYSGDGAWDYVKTRTRIDLKSVLETLVEENTEQHGN